MTVRVRCCRLHEQPRIVSPPALPLLIADHRVVAGDVLTAVGLLRWGLDLQRSEIQVLLAGRGIALSTGEISALSTEFLLRFFLLHHRRADRIRAHLQTLPGTVWLVDGTQDEGSEVVFVVQEGFSRIVLDADLLPNEGRTAVALVLQRNRSEFGVPDALLRDFSPEIREAARRVLPGVPQIGCHVHFGRNLGEHLFETTYGALRQAVLQTKVLTRLLDLRRRLLERTGESLLVRAFDHWARLAVEYLDEPRRHLSRYPMTLPYHACVARAFEVEDWCRRVVRALAARNTTVPSVGELEALLRGRLHGEAVIVPFSRLTRAQAWFEEIRAVLRLSRNRLGDPPPAPRPVGEVAEELSRTLERIREESRRMGGPYAALGELLWEYTAEHVGELLAPVVGRDGRELLVDRVTNLVESRHRWNRQKARRRTGRGRTSREMVLHGPLLAVFSNLFNRAYVEAVLGDVRSLPVELMAIPAEEVEALRERLATGRKPKGLPVRDEERAGRLLELVEVLEGGGDAEDGLMVGWLQGVTSQDLTEV